MKAVTSIQALASALAKSEGRKHQASVGDCREILGILSDFAFAHPFFFFKMLYVNGGKRAKRKAK